MAREEVRQGDSPDGDRLWRARDIGPVEGAGARVSIIQKELTFAGLASDSYRIAHDPGLVLQASRQGRCRLTPKDAAAVAVPSLEREAPLVHAQVNHDGARIQNVEDGML